MRETLGPKVNPGDAGDDSTPNPGDRIIGSAFGLWLKSAERLTHWNTSMPYCTRVTLNEKIVQAPPS
jgi:hypothetical protein